jgi:2-succinyl-6-hydroxy-2,4-cyclohexadiene-1-carboxylate synthase
VPETLVLLHGFGGTRHAWDRVAAELPPERYLPLALDLPGHGDGADEDAEITFDSCVRAVLARSPDRLLLCGYSLGGRVALHVALAAPERVQRLVLVASSAGIEDDAERAQRRAADRGLADELERIPFEDQRRNRPRALAAALRGIGTGEMEPLWGRLGELEMPVTVVVGERDAKFQALGERMVGRMPRAELVVIPGGHRLPLESPAELASVLD